MRNFLCFANRPRLLNTFIALASLFALVGCMESKAPEPRPELGYFTIYNACPDSPGLNILVDGEQMNSLPFNYSDFTPALAAKVGDRVISITTGGASPLASTVLEFEENDNYSLYVVNNLAQVAILPINNDVLTPSAGKVMVRFVHASPIASVAALVFDGETPTTIFANVGSIQVTPFKEIDAQIYGLKVLENATENVLAERSNYLFQEGGFYTVIFQGPAEDLEVVIVKET